MIRSIHKSNMKLSCRLPAENNKAQQVTTGDNGNNKDFSPTGLCLGAGSLHLKKQKKENKRGTAQSDIGRLKKDTIAL